MKISISTGELFDKFTILSIKLNKITDPEKREILTTEFKLLEKKIDNFVRGDVIKVIFLKKLVDVNTKLWDIEDGIREMESKKDFGKEFIELARSVYKTNDKRSQIKTDINNYYSSEIEEVKQYDKY